MAQLGKGKSIAVAFLGKLKTVAQMTAIIALLLHEPLIPGISTPLVGTIALWVAAILTLWSMVHYLKLAAPHFRARSEGASLGRLATSTGSLTHEKQRSGLTRNSRKSYN
jgi:hypothetical protein